MTVMDPEFSSLSHDGRKSKHPNDWTFTCKGEPVAKHPKRGHVTTGGCGAVGTLDLSHK